MLPYKCEPLQQYPLALFRSRWAHKRGRCLLQLLSTCKKSRSNCTYNRGCGSDQCEARLIINGNGICHIVIHNPISSYNNVWNDFLSDQHSQHTAKKSCKKCITDIFCCNSRLLISQCLQGTDLGSLLLHHTSHSGKTDQCRYQEKDDRENLTDVSKTVCIITVIRIFRKLLPICDHPLRHFQIFQFLFRIIQLLLILGNLILRIFFGVFVLFLSICKVFLTFFQVFNRILKLFLIVCNLFFTVCKLLLIVCDFFLTIGKLRLIFCNFLLSGSKLFLIFRDLPGTGIILFQTGSILRFTVIQLCHIGIQFRLSGSQGLCIGINFFLGFIQFFLCCL